ncbi:MAG: hypothetical protein JWN48_2185 [Myxococcaceae bacterium]|nr:hypothetical protein [Myxococcaceae bacterium]
MKKLKLVAIGDSLTQGFQSAAVDQHKVSWSSAAIIARALGLGLPLDFRVPPIPGPGLPLNLEDLLRSAQDKLGAQLEPSAWLTRFPLFLQRYLDEVEDFYERGGGALPVKKPTGIYQNLAVWGYTVRESLSLTLERCLHVIDKEEGFLDDDFLGIPAGPMYRTALRVLNPWYDHLRMLDTQVGTFERLAAQEDVDVLLLGLGANDCLGTVLTLQIKDMADAQGPISDDPMERLRWNLTSAPQFEKDYRELVTRIAKALLGKQTQVFVSNIPHVTIPPITTGIGTFRDGYFDAYARFFVNNDNRPTLTEKLTREDAVRIDRRIDAFNATIKAEAERHGWHLVDLCGLLDALAVKRQQKAPEEPLREYLADRPDHPLLALDPTPSILHLRLDDAGKRRQGGLFSLDGVHPSTIGYGLIAELHLKAMKGVVEGAEAAKVPWRDVIANDSLLTSPPRLWEETMRTAEHHAGLWNLIVRALA